MPPLNITSHDLNMISQDLNVISHDMLNHNNSYLLSYDVNGQPIITEPQFTVNNEQIQHLNQSLSLVPSNEVQISPFENDPSTSTKQTLEFMPEKQVPLEDVNNNNPDDADYSQSDTSDQ